MVWGGADILRGIVEVAKWPFERAIWAVERGFLWPLEERSGDWSASVRLLGIAGLAVLAAGAGVLGLLWASGSGGGGGTSSVQEAATPVATPLVRQAPPAATTAPAPVLQGAKPDFADAPQSSTSQSSGTPASRESAATSSGSTAEVAKSSSSGTEAGASGTAKPVGPAATKVAHQFANAFVLYEIGRATPAVRNVFNETATPRLTHELLRRPPRQPAGVEVPKAKVLNVVAGPHHGDTYTLSVSLLRVGVTSELRLDMERNPKSGEWEVTNSLG